MAAERQPGLIVEAEDAELCHRTGETQEVGFPPQRVLVLQPDAALSLRFDAGAIYLRLPLEFTLPGPHYGLVCDAAARVRWFIDDRPRGECIPFRMPREFLLAEGLSAGAHTLRLQAVGGPLAIDGFRLAPAPLSRVEGLITADVSAMELLVDVRADLYAGPDLVRTEYVRTPHDGGSFQLLGLPPGQYRLRLTAAGWLPLELPAVTVERAAATVDLGVLVLRRDPWALRQSWYGDAAPRFGKTITVAPGGSFRTRVFLASGPAQTAWLKSRHRTVPLQVADVHPEDYGRWNGVGLATFTVPADAPQEMYALQVGGRLLPQAVCVRAPLPEQFHLAGISHFHVWGQRQAGVMQRMAEMAQLAGARALLLANEVNPAYISGALMDLRIPYAVSRGNHMTGRWSEFYGWSATAMDDGPMRLVSFGGFPYESVAEPRELFRERPEATCRVLLCYEGFVPISLIRDEALDVIFDGHSDDPHPELAQFPPGALHFRAPGGSYLRWIPMTHEGLHPSVTTADDIPLLYVPRDGPAPLRAQFARPNDGSADANTVEIINETTQRFPAGRLRLLMKSGRYAVSGADVQQSFTSDDGQLTIIDLTLELPAQSRVPIACRPAPG